MSNIYPSMFKLRKLVIMDSVFRQKKLSLIDLDSTNVNMKLLHHKNHMFFNRKFYVYYNLLLTSKIVAS
jgi:hypothetical protein